MSFVKLAFFFSSILLVTACTKVIQVDLNKANQRIVVDGTLSLAKKDSTDLQAVVRLSRTGSFYENNSFDTISKANLYIKTPNGNSFPLHYVGKGVFENNAVPNGKTKDDYTLYGTIEGVKISAKSSMPNFCPIDSIGAYYLPFGPPHKLSQLTPICFFTDIPNEANYYRLEIKINGHQLEGLYISRDDGQDGKMIAYPFIKVHILKGDTLNISLLSMDKASFDYYKVLKQNIGSGGFGAAPGNPNSNIEGNVIGIFTAQTVSSKTLIIR